MTHGLPTTVESINRNQRLAPNKKPEEVWKTLTQTERDAVNASCGEQVARALESNQLLGLQELDTGVYTAKYLELMLRDIQHRPQLLDAYLQDYRAKQAGLEL